MTEAITDAMAGLGFESRSNGIYAMYVLGELMLCHAERTPEGVMVRGDIFHRGSDDETTVWRQTAKQAENIATHGTIGDATEAAAMMVAVDLLIPTLDRAGELLREALSVWLTESQQQRYASIGFGFAVDHHDSTESPGLELTIVGVSPLVECEAILPDVALYPGDLTAARIAELGEALAGSIAQWERDEL